MNESIEHIWQRIERHLNPEQIEKFEAGAAEEEIVELENYLNAYLPPDFRDSLKVHNGNNGFVLSDGRDNVRLFNIQQLKEEFDYQKKFRKELSEEYAENKQVFKDIEIPILKFANGDTSKINLKTGEIVYFSHDSSKTTKWENFYSFLKKIADNLDSGRFYMGEYGMCSVYIDDAWKKIDETGKLSGHLNVCTPEYEDENEESKLFAFIKEKAQLKKILSLINEHFYRTYYISHNGQKTRDAIFTDGEEKWSLLPMHQIITEFEDIKIQDCFVVPLFKNHQNGRKIFIDVLAKSYNSSSLYKKSLQSGEFVKMDKDLVDILLATWVENK